MRNVESRVNPREEAGKDIHARMLSRRLIAYCISNGIPLPFTAESENGEIVLTVTRQKK